MPTEKKNTKFVTRNQRPKEIVVSEVDPAKGVKKETVAMKTGGMVNPNVRSMAVDANGAYKSNKMRKSMPRGY